MNKTISNISLIKERLQPQYLGEMGHEHTIVLKTRALQYENNNPSCLEVIIFYGFFHPGRIFF